MRDAAQGVYPPSTFSMLNIAPAWYSSVEWQYPPHERQGAYEEEGRAINTLKVGWERALPPALSHG